MFLFSIHSFRENYTERCNGVGKMIRLICLAFVLAVSMAGCATTPTGVGGINARSPSHWLISIADQRLYVLENDTVDANYLISTAKDGVGEIQGGNTTPRGWHQVSEKIGDGAAVGAVFAGRVLTGEIVAINPPVRTPVVTRILRLAGLEAANANTHDRLIYIHGSPVENLLGQPASGGCIRLSSTDVVTLYAQAQVGTRVLIQEAPYTTKHLNAIGQIQAHSAQLESKF